MKELCELCVYYSNEIKNYAWYSNDHDVIHWKTNLLICNSCIKQKADAIEILSISTLNEIPFKLKKGKQIIELFYTK